MTTTMKFNAPEVTTLRTENNRRLRDGMEFMTTNKVDESDSIYQSLYHQVDWNGYLLNEENADWVDPIILKSQGVNPFPDNQGKVIFTIPGSMVLNALEPSPYTGGSFHVLVPSYAGGWDYARTMCNMSWWQRKETGDESYIDKREDIVPEAMYEVTCFGGCGYVYIRKVSDSRKEE